MELDENIASIARVISFIVLVVAFQVAVARLSLQREAKRRWQHALTGQGLVLISYYLPINIGTLGLLIGAAGIAYLRFFQAELYTKAFGPLLRPNERDGLPGAFFFLLGAAISVQIFPLQVARYGVLCLSWADPMAAWVGRSVPLASLHSSASLGGCLACWMTSVAIGCLVLEGDMSSWECILAGAVGCTLAEASPFGNDNLLIPLLTGAAVLSR